jgi:KipI family sensor histidine kinase inhibitor
MRKDDKTAQQARYYLLGEKAVVLELEGPATLESQRRIWALSDHLAHQPEVEEVIPGMNNLTALLKHPQHSGVEIIHKLRNLWLVSQAAEFESRLIDVPVHYGGEMGPDLDFVAEHCGMSARQVVECHASVEYVVYFLGFQPGFSYMGGLPEALHTPRRAEPRLIVPKGTVAIGGSQTGIYPLQTPGGWQLIGHTAKALFDPKRHPPTLLQPGDKVRFIPSSEGVC